MKAGVCIKLVPSLEGQISISDPSKGVDTGSKLIINPYDEHALEEAVSLKEKGVFESVTAYIISSDKKSLSQIRTALARGADSAVHINDPSLNNADGLLISSLLSAAMKEDEIQVVFCGKQSIDGDSSQIPPMIAEHMDCAQATAISKLEIEGENFKAWRDIGGGNKGLVSGSIPAVFSCDKVLNNPRFIKLKDRTKAKKKPVKTITAGDLGIDASGAVVSYSNWGLPSRKEECRFIEGDTQTAVAELVRLLREEAKVI
ncbi:MAG: electron transfer flavoprotein subunit beta/FixA family protein [Myxococcota bacterium]|nr:electron transfer flavoprotein subunit beta/FixA family protein [Myxococcota bacterium]